MRRVVITRTGVVSPNALCFDEFSENLRKGKSGLGDIDYFNPDTFPCRIVGQVKNFDKDRLRAKFPRLRCIEDNKVFFGLDAFLQLLEHRDDGFRECPVNLGTSLEVFLIEKAFQFSPYTFDMDRYVTTLKNGNNEPYLQVPLDFLGNFIKDEFSITGANYVNCSACAASTQAIGHSFHMIRDGRYDEIIAGGFDSMLNPIGLGGFSRLGALCMDNELKEKAIRPFDLRRQGTVLGEGAAMFILKELEHALKTDETILGEIIGYGASFDAYKLSEPESDGSGIGSSMGKALKDAGIGPDDVDYINAHGTGTLSNDKVETIAIKRVFQDRAYKIPVSSTKSMIGHLIGAAGAVEIAAVLAMFRDNFIAPTINLEKRDPECDLDYVPNHSRNEKINIALKNSMGFGGQNATIILKRYEG